MNRIFGIYNWTWKIRMDPGKIEAVKDWKSPTTKKELQTFLGFAISTQIHQGLCKILRIVWSSFLVVGLFHL